MVRLALLCLALLLCAAAPAAAMVRLPAIPRPVAGNPADKLLSVPIEDSSYDPAKRCTPKAARPGIAALTRWLRANPRGVSWGSYRCENWGKGQASLHAENRAIDWHLDVRRMGVEELIWDCGYSGAGMTEFTEYRPCYAKNGKLRKHVDPTVGHRNHVHLGMTKAGAAARTSFWRGRR